MTRQYVALVEVMGQPEWLDVTKFVTDGGLKLGGVLLEPDVLRELADVIERSPDGVYDFKS